MRAARGGGLIYGCVSNKFLHFLTPEQRRHSRSRACTRSNFYIAAQYCLHCIVAGQHHSWLQNLEWVAAKKVPYYDINMNYVLSPPPPPRESHNFTRRGGERCFSAKTCLVAYLHGALCSKNLPRLQSFSLLPCNAL